MPVVMCVLGPVLSCYCYAVPGIYILYNKDFLTELRRCFSSWMHFLHSTVELHLSGLIGTASHPTVQKIRIIGFFWVEGQGWVTLTV